jgi:hypothetical protein
VDPRAVLDTEARGKILSPLPGIEPQSPGRPATVLTLQKFGSTERNKINKPVNHDKVSNFVYHVIFKVLPASFEGWFDIREKKAFRCDCRTLVQYRKFVQSASAHCR